MYVDGNKTKREGVRESLVSQASELIHESPGTQLLDMYLGSGAFFSQDSYRCTFRKIGRELAFGGRESEITAAVSDSKVSGTPYLEGLISKYRFSKVSLSKSRRFRNSFIRMEQCLLCM